MAQIDFPKAGAPIGRVSYAYMASDISAFVFAIKPSTDQPWTVPQVRAMTRFAGIRKARGLRIHARRVKAAKRRAA